MDKDSTTTTIGAAGEVVPYTFVVDNTGNQTLTNVVVTDPNCDSAPVLVSGDTNLDNKLQVDETWTYTCDHTVTQDEIDSSGDLDNTVTATSDQAGPVQDTHSIPIEEGAAISVDKDSTTTTIGAAGEVVPYTFVVDNTGNQTLTNVVVTDPNCDSAPVLVSGDTNLDNKLQVDETWTYTCDHTVTQDEIDSSGDLDNTVTATSDQAGPVQDTHSIPIEEGAAISVDKDSTTTTIGAAGEVVPYTFVVDNTGNQTLTNVVVTDPNCDSAPVLVSGDTNLDNKLQVDETWTYTCDHTVTQDEIDSSGDLDNTVTATSDQAGPVQDTHSIPIEEGAAISVDKDSTTTTIGAAGEVVPYTFVVDNTGNQTLTNVVVTDPNCELGPGPGLRRHEPRQQAAGR